MILLGTTKVRQRKRNFNSVIMGYDQSPLKRNVQDYFEERKATLHLIAKIYTI